MKSDVGGDDAPIPDVYSTVTDPERFAPLHQHALDVFARLASEYDVGREEGYELSGGLEKDSLSRPSIRLTPRNPREAPVQVAFTSFPGVHLWVGRWYRAAFPACGCDGCAETLESALDDGIDNAE